MERDGSDMSSAVIFSITVSSVTLGPGPDSLEPKPRTLDSVTLGSEPDSVFLGPGPNSDVLGPGPDSVTLEPRPCTLDPIPDSPWLVVHVS